MSVARWSVPVRVLWAGCVLGALYAMGDGLSRTFYFEPTSEALAGARVGVALIWGASLVLVAAAVLAARLGGSRWLGGSVAVPAVLCGGLALVAPETLFPQLAVLLAYPVALGGVVAVVVRGQRGETPVEHARG